MIKRDKGDLLIGFDLGTSTIKALLSNTNGKIIEQTSRPVNLHHPAESRVEIDPEGYFQDICSIIREFVKNTNQAENIKALSFSGASGNTIILDENYLPLDNAISWMDRRTAGTKMELWSELDLEKLYYSTGWPFKGTFPLAHLSWYKHYKPELWKKTRHFSMLNDYIYYRLCGRLAVDYSKATTFFLFDQVKSLWNTSLLDLLNITDNDLAEMLPSGTACGTIMPEITEMTGLQTKTQIVTGSFDHPSAARSTGVFEEGNVLISAGTSWVAFSPVRNRETALKWKMLVDPFLSPAGCWGSMVALTGIAEKMEEYLVNCIGSNEDESLFARYDRLASEAEPGADGLYIELFKQPYIQMKDQLKDIQPKNIARALMEGIVFLIRNRIEKLTSLTGKPIDRIVLTGGPTKSSIWPSILADVSGQPIVIPETGQHAGAMGAVMLAGIGVGLYSDEHDAYEQTKSQELIIEPDPVRSKLYQKIYKDYIKHFEIDS
ncbi:hypothetical protein EXM22_14685 [Oceanispirochaeta crateris]|uniref:Carbohydrate kinase n=1 Tax=Oceanispirochaeta crateris TaxID=2518645 RepID=A0A5C1QRA8_9SPIO|nr:FGGY family carbohydrate kinase [Oceanispirochaeta crateris]QEN09164.1 hypothetical protein EXM22_14685 [Oceanispirochaeta crateris]